MRLNRLTLTDHRNIARAELLPENGTDFIYLVLPVRFKNEG